MSLLSSCCFLELRIYFCLLFGFESAFADHNFRQKYIAEKNRRRRQYAAAFVTRGAEAYSDLANEFLKQNR